MSDDLSGTYISMSGVGMRFEIGPVMLSSEREYLLSLDGRSSGVASATEGRAPGWKGALGSTFWVTTDEFEHFKANVLDKNIGWLLGNGVTVPGTWSLEQVVKPLKN